MTLTIAISGNVRVGQRFREKLMERLKQLPFNRMLGKRNLDVNDYLHNMPVTDIEKQLRNCDECTAKEECKETLEDEEKSEKDYSFCPNDEYFKQAKSSESKPSTGYDNAE